MDGADIPRLRCPGHPWVAAGTLGAALVSSLAHRESSQSHSAHMAPWTATLFQRGSAQPGLASVTPLVPCSGDMSQMGTLISLDCLLYQMKAERTVDIFGVTLQLARSCCLMTPTLVGGKKGWWAGWSRVFVLTCLELAASCPLLGAPCCLGACPASAGIYFMLLPHPVALPATKG